MRNAAGIYDDLPEEQTGQWFPGVTIPREMPDLNALLHAMRGRYSSNPIDKVWAIAFPFQRRKARNNVVVTLPIYDASTPVSAAWGRLISTMASTNIDVTPPTFDPDIGFWVIIREFLKLVSLKLWEHRWEIFWRVLKRLGGRKSLASTDAGTEYRYRPVVPDHRKKLWQDAIFATPRVNDPTWVSGGLTVQQSPTIQLLRLFPHPSRHHWFPSWTQVQQYPDVSIRDDDQGSDPVLVAGNMDYSLRIMSGRIYRGCSLQLTQSPTLEKKAIYCSTISGKDAQLEATVPGIDLNINPQGNYVLVDISPDSSLWPFGNEEFSESNIHLLHRILDCCKETDEGHHHPPVWNKSVILVCEEVDTPAQPITDTAPVTKGSLTMIRYRLRRVTTLEWNCRPSPMPANPTSTSPGHWLPFEPSLVHMRSVVCSATGGLHSVSPLMDDPDVFCDPEVTGLWSQGEWHEEWYKQWPVYGVYLV